MITPVRRSTLHEVISKAIIKQIVKGEWKPGTRIPGEISLSEQFLVSRNSIRESIKALELIGLFKSTPGKGTFVADHALDRIHLLRIDSETEPFNPIVYLIEVLEMRLVVEPGLCWLAGKFASKDSLRKMEDIVISSRDAINQKDYCFELGMAFHEELYNASKNDALISLFKGMKERFITARREIYVKLTKKEDIVQQITEHNEIFELIKQKRGEEATIKMRQHLYGPLMRVKNHYQVN